MQLQLRRQLVAEGVEGCNGRERVSDGVSSCNSSISAFKNGDLKNSVFLSAVEVAIIVMESIIALFIGNSEMGKTEFSIKIIEID
jgi:hypothetical protein